MSLSPKRLEHRLLAHLSSGENTATYSLIEAAYFERLQRAESIIESEPEQINTQEPFAGLSPLHIAIFRSNTLMVRLIADHRETRFDLKDNFQRRAVDMCIYASDPAIYDLLIERTFGPVARGLSFSVIE